MRKQQKKYSRPRRPFDRQRIDEENVLRERYGLKNKREIWKADAAVRRIRGLAKQFITQSEDEQKEFVGRLQKKGFVVTGIADVLALDKEDWLKRRLQTIVTTKRLSNTPKQARQLITHKHVAIGNQIVNIPSYHVSAEEESHIRVLIALPSVTEPSEKNEDAAFAEEMALENTPEEEPSIGTSPEEVPSPKEKPIEVSA